MDIVLWLFMLFVLGGVFGWACWPILSQMVSSKEEEEARELEEDVPCREHDSGYVTTSIASGTPSKWDTLRAKYRPPLQVDSFYATDILESMQHAQELSFQPPSYTSRDDNDKGGSFSSPELAKSEQSTWHSAPDSHTSRNEYSSATSYSSYSSDYSSSSSSSSDYGSSSSSSSSDSGSSASFSSD